METIRAIRRLILFLAVTFTAIMLLLAGLLLRLFGAAVFERWRIVVVQGWARLIARVIGMRITVIGTPPKPPFLLVSNHLSYVDIPLLFTRLRGIFIAKREVSSWPLLGYAARLINTLFIDRKNHRDLNRVNRLIAAHINPRQGVILFPEGTSSPGAEIKPFRPSLLQYPADAGLPVHYATISYRSGNPAYPAHTKICWWGGMTFGDHLFEMFKIRQFEATIVFGSQPLAHRDRKQLAALLWASARQSFIPVVNLEEICTTDNPSSSTTSKPLSRELT